MRIFPLLLFTFFCAFSTFAQEVDSTLIKVDSLKSVVRDTTKLQDTAAVVAKETRQERRAREKAEKERAKYYYKDILKDSARLEIEHVSRVAWRRSMFVPGWGQYTNGGLWWIKVPIIYGGFTALYMTFDYWNWYYQKFVDEAAYRSDNSNATNDPDLVNITLEGLIQRKDNYRRYRDWTIIGAVALWGVNVIEAYTDSMLRNRYNISDDLSIKINPTVLPATSGLAYQAPLRGYFVPGLKLTMTLK